jgi:4'-phosphopantetheinyl transferase
MSDQTLPPDEVHVWRASLDRPLSGLDALLSADERARADRFRFDRDRSRFVAARGLLRELLARYTGVAPARLTFRYGAFEKPFLDGPGPWFNVSHSGPLALFAVGARAELGIDVERFDPEFVAGRIPEHFFSAAEVRALRSLPVDEQARAFLTCWTRKEAFIKARGDGLSLALDSFDVTLEPGRPAALLRTAWSASEPAEWSVVDLSDPAGEYAAALASRDRGWQVRLRDVPA